MKGWRLWLVVTAELFGFLFCLMAGYFLLLVIDTFYL
jgi:hypothetical protein